MKRKSFWNSLLVFCLIGFSTIASFISCEVGLGPAVDVESPDIIIDTPPTSAIIRDKFAIAGTWSDDGSIKGLEVTLKNTRTKKSYELKNGVVNQDPDSKDFKGDWSVIVNPFDDKTPLPDGTYEATITITDNGKHKTQISRSFIIDNTAPVVVIQRPSSKAGDTVADLFGQTLSLTGQAADDNNINKIRVRFYSDPECKNPIGDDFYVDKDNVPPTISLDVAKFVENEDNDYAKIYGSLKKEGKKPPVYCSIIAYDEAKRYPITPLDAKDDDEFGNSTDSYYLYDDIYADVLSTFKVTELYSIMNGTFDDASRAAATTSIPEKLKPFATKTGKFQLNPANNPEYKVVGREGLEKDENGKLLAYNFANPANDLTNESNITVKVDVGLDAIPLNVQTLRVYLLPCNADGTVDDKPENRIYPNPSDPPYEKNGTGYTFTTKIVKDACKDKDGKDVLLTIGQPYVIAMEGFDSMSNEVVAESDDNGSPKVFGFRLAPNGAAPILDIQTSINSAALSDDSMLYVPRYNPADTTKITTLKFEGTVTVEDGEPTVEYSIDGNPRQRLTITATGNKGEFSFGTQITVDDFVFDTTEAEPEKKSGQHNIIFYANQTQDATPVKKTLMYQVDGPKVTLSRLEPTAYNYYYGDNGALVETGKAETETVDGKEVTKKYLNGANVKVPVTIIAGAVGLEEEGPRKPVIEFIQGDQTKLTIDAPTFGETDEIDTTQFTTGELLIRITAYDLAGNKGVTEETYYVNQNTDVPVILPKNSTDSTLSRTKQQVTDSNEKNVYSANQTVSYRLIDDDGLKTAAYGIWRQEASGPETEIKGLAETQINLNDATDYQFEITMPDTPATYRVKINTTDKNNLSHPGAEFYVRVTASAPTIDEISLSKTLFKEENIEPQIVIKSDQKPFTLSRVVKDADGNEIAAYTKTYTKDDEGMGNLANDSPTIGDTISVSAGITASGRYSVEYLVEDVNGKKSSPSEKFFNVDLTAPQINAIKLNDAAITASSWYNSTTLSLAVDVSDAEDVAGTSTSTVEYSTDDKAWDAADKVWTSLSYNSSSLKYAGSAVFASEGENNKLFIRATDKAGNTTYHKLSAGVPVCDTIKIDGSAPELTVSNNQTVYVKSGETITVSGTYEDPHSGVNNLTFNIDGTDITPTVTYTTVANGADTWTTTFVPAISGKLGITGHNKAGLATSELKAFDIMIDTSDPQNSNVKLGAYKGLDTNYEPISEEAYLKPSDSKYYVNNNKTFVISGVSTDDTGIKSVTLKVENNISQNPEPTKTPTKNGSNSKWYFTFNMDGWSTQAKATVTVTDNAGRTSTEIFNIVFDKTAPKALHEVDSKHKDIYFRIGKADNDKKTNDDSTVVWETDDPIDAANNPLNEDVGKKYSFGTWGNDSTIEIRGTFEENGAGLKTIHYAIFKANPATIKINRGTQEISLLDAFVNGTLKNSESNDILVISSFAPLTTAETRHVPFNTANGKVSRTVESNFRTQLSGFDVQKNYLVLIAEDNAGNRAADTLAQTTGSALNSKWNSENHDTATPYYTINKDTVAPTITSTTESQFTNGKTGAADIEIIGTATDEDAKVAYVTVTVEEIGFSQKIEAKDFIGANKDTWKATIPATDFNTLGSFTVYAEATDNAGVGNKKKISATTINVDVYGPTVKIITPSSNDKVPTKFKFEGTANDGTGAGVAVNQKVSLYYTKDSSKKDKNPLSNDGTGGNPNNAWVKLSDRAAFAVNGQDWSYTIDLTTLKYTNQSVAPADADTTLYFKAEAQDKSGTGNHGFSDTVEVVVDRKAPVKDTFNVDETADTGLSGKYFSNKTVNINGNFTDSASGVKKVWYQVKKNGEDEYGDAASVASDGSFNVNIKDLNDGDNKIKVWAEDAAVPLGGTNGNESAAVEYTVKVDSQPPSINTTYDGVIFANSSNCSIALSVTDSGTGSSGIKEVKIEIGTDTYVCTPENGIYKKVLSVDDIPEGTASVTAKATDNAGNSVSKVVANIMKDTTGPEITINTPTTGDSRGTSIQFKGTVSDGTGSGVDTEEGLTLYYRTSPSGSWVAYATKPNLNINGKDWTCTFTATDTLAPSGADTPLYFRVGAKDTAGTGNQGYSDVLTVTVDRKAPAVSSIKVDNQASSTLGSSTTFWFKNQTVNLNGTFGDSASGVNKVWYQVKKGTANYTTATSVASDGTFSINIQGLVSGENRIKVWAEDKYGNTNSASATECYVKVDTEAPDIGYLTGNIYTNASANLDLEFTVDDKPSTGAKSGINTVTVKVGDNTTATASLKSGTTNTYTATIAKNNIPKVTGSTSQYAINVTATDKADNSNIVKIGNLIVDLSLPTIKIAAITDADTSSSVTDVNGTITLSGTASDDDTLASVAVAYKLKSAADTDANWHSISSTGTNTWTASLDTTTLTNNTEYTIRAVSTDAAGNTKKDTADIKVNQDSDRPIITLMQIEKNNATTLLAKDIMGSITDDDGTDGLMLWYANGSKPTAPSYSNNTWTATGWTPITLNGTSWTYSYTGDDGQFNWYFAVGDAQHGVFVTDGTKKPYIKYYNQTSKENNTAATQFKIDTVAPNITSIQMLRRDNTNAVTASTNGWTTDIDSLKFGGSYKYLYAKIVVTEKTAMDTAAPLACDYLGTITVGSNCTASGPSSNQYTYIVGPIDISSKATGTPSLSFTVKDGSGKTDSDNASIKVDFASPAIVIATPDDKDTSTTNVVDVNGKITIVGTASDENTISSVAVAYKLKSGSTWETTALSEQTGTNAWSAKLDTTQLTDNTEYTIRVVATDDSGNNASQTTDVKVNQDTDRPVIQMSQITANNAAVYLPSKTVFGSIADDDGIINKLWLWSTKLNGGNAPSSAPALSNTGTGPTGWISIGNADKSSLANNNWQIESTETDGSTTWYWAVADADNTIFWSKAGITASDTTGTVLSQPYVKYSGSDTKNTEKAGITFKYDTESPEINSIKLIRLPTPAADETLYTASQIEAQMGSLGVNWSDDSNIPFGADKGLMYMQVIVKERTAMPTDTSKNLLKIKLNSSDEDFLTVTRTGADANIHNATTDADTAGTDPKYTYILGPFNMTKNAVKGLPAISTTSGIKTLKLVAYDDAGRSTSREKVITVDNDANIKITGVSPKPTAETSGEFTLRGSVEDAESSISAMYYHIPSTSVYDSWSSAANATAKTAVLAAVEDAGSQDATNGWKLIDNSNGAISWRIDFTTLNKMIGYSTEGGNDATVDENFSGYDITTNPSEPQFVYNLPIWIKVIDEVGNVGYVTRTSATTTPPEEAADIKVKYNPNADRPTVEIIDPEIDPNGIARGGTIKISGAASDNEGISGVYLQFDLDGDGTYGNEINDTSIFRTPGQGETIEKPFTAQDIVPIPYTNLYGIKASGTRNWNYKFNVTGIKNYADTSKKIKVRAIAIDSDSSNPYVSAWSDELLIKVNNDIPSFEDLYVVQRSGTAYDGTELVRREYERNMFIKYEPGKTWFLEGKVKTTSTYLKKIMPEEYAVDASGNKTSTLKSYEWTGDGSDLTEVTNNQSSPIGNAAYENGGKTISFQIPISSGGDWHSSIYAKDDKANENEGEATAYYEVKIDNVAPTFPDIYTAGEAPDTYQSIRLYRDSYGESLNRLDNGKAKVQNSNGSRFTLSGKIEEKGSGFDKAVFYIKRIGNDNKPRVYNIMESHGKNNDANRTYMSSLEEQDNLPVLPVTVTKEGTTGDVFSADEIKTNMNIRTGGLVYIGGLYRTITAVNRNDGEVTIYPTYQGTETSALFVYGMVVDSTGENEAADGTIYESDNDGLLESYSGNQNIDYRWDATFNSANIPDGPIEIHVVTFDKAGNIGHGYMKTRAENNAPRITKVMLGTDLNGNNKFDYGSGEFKTFYLMLDEYNNPVTKTGTAGWNLDTSKSMGGTDVYWKVKKDIAVIPEFVGGAGPFYYNFSKGDSGIREAAKLRTSAADTTDISGKQLKASGANDLIQHKKTDGTYEPADWGYSRADNVGGSLTMTSAELTDEALGTNVEDDPTFYCFSFWDSTEDSTAGFDTGSCVLNIKLAQDLVDNNAPSAAVNPFEWKNASGYIKTTSVTVDNKTPTVTAASIEVLGDDDVLGTVSSTEIKIDSVTEVSTTTVTTTTITPNNSLYGASTANGHIELENELGSLSTHQFNNTTLGTDPKVSGKITFHGTAYDDTRLSSIWFKFDGFANPANGITTGDYNATNKPSGYVQAASYNTSNGTWTNATAKMATDGWEMRVTDTSFDQSGHTADWYLSIDTSKITNLVGLDKALSVVAMDGKSGTNNAQRPSATSTTQTTTSAKTPYYKMDVVPYITKVTTRLARKDVPSRTALGHYPIASNEAADANTPVVLSGFNLAANNGNVNLANDVISDLSSGDYAYPVGNTGISTINNLNNNDAHGSYNINVTGLAETTKVANMYNRQPDSNTNLNLTDDVYFDVWEINNDAATSGYPALKYPVMHINPANNQIGFGFVRGTDSISFPANGNSYTWYQTNRKDYVSTNFVYDSKGVAHTISIGLDAQFDTGIAGRMNYNNSTWYNDNNKGTINIIKQWDKTYNIALESIGIPNGVYVKGTQTNVTGGQGIIDIERFSTPSIAVATHDNNTAVYIIYYDTNHDQIRFRYGSVPNNGNARGNNNYGLLNDSKSERQRCTSQNNDNANTQTILSDTTTDNHTYNAHGMFEADREFYSLVTGKYYKQSHDSNANEGIPDNTAAGTMVYDTGNNGSEIHAIGVVPSTSMNDDKVVMVWYDKTVNKLKYMYRTNLGTNTTALSRTDAKRDADSDGVSAGGTVYWSAPKDLFGNTSLPVSKIALTIDKNNGIHVAAYDQTNADLVYAYLPTYNHLDNANNSAYICRVDAYSQVGTDLTIDTAIVDNKVVPYISYYAEGLGALPKMAYLISGIDTTSATTIKNSIVDGANKDSKLFTGKWEVTIVPTASSLQRYDVSIGLFKTTAGALTTPDEVTDVVTSKDERKRYANGSTNLVVGYSIKNNGIGYIETAMRKGVPDKIQH